jgi:hypothetical protein
MNDFKCFLYFLRLTNDVNFIYTWCDLPIVTVKRTTFFIAPHLRKFTINVVSNKISLKFCRVLPSMVSLDRPSAFTILLSSYDNGSYKDNLLKLHKYLLEFNVLQLCHGRHIVLTQSRVSTSSG